MNCSICSEPIILIPSARERAAKFGGTPADYTHLFTTHSACLVKKRKQESIELIRRLFVERKIYIP